MFNLTWFFCFFIKLLKINIRPVAGHNKKLRRILTFRKIIFQKGKTLKMKNFLFLVAIFICSVAPGQSWTKQYDHVNEPCCGLAKVKKDHKYGFVNSKGKVIIPIIYDEALNFSEGIAAVSKAAKWGFVDSTGKEIIPLQYSDALPFTEGVALVANGNKYGFIDKGGRPVISGDYTNARCFSEGIAPVSNQKNQWGYIDKSGKEVIAFQFQYADIFTNGQARVMKAGKWLVIDRNGKVVNEE